MPIYTYACCGEEWESFRTIKNRRRERCKQCDKKATIIITLTSRPVVKDYYDDGLGERVTGARHRKHLMRQKDLEEVG